jgi:hypothetical protein
MKRNRLTFYQKLAEAIALQAEIDRLDREIDEMVYELVWVE